MHRVFFGKWCLTGFILIMLTGCGVNRSNWQNPAVWSPLHQRQADSDERIAASFYQQAQQLKVLAADAEHMSFGVQRRHVQELLVSVREESNPLLRAEVVKALAAFPIVEADEGLRLAIEDPVTDVRIVACDAWSRRGGSEALRELTKTLNSDTNLDVRLAATRGLARFRDPAVIPALATALNDSDPALQYAAVESLQAVSGQNYGYNTAAWREFVQGREPHVATPIMAKRFWPWSWF